MTPPVLVSIAHGPVLAAIHAESFSPDAVWGTDAIVLHIGLPGTFAWLAATGEDEPQGFILARVAADEAEILTLAVRPAHRRHGIGALLLDAAITHAASLGAAAMLLEVATSNAAAVALYTRQGFHQVGRRRNYYGSGADALVLRRDIISICDTISPGGSKAT